IRHETTEQVVQVLRQYRQVLEQYGITPGPSLRVVATSAVREAQNRMTFLDRVYIATGIDIEPIDDAEVSRITYMGLRPILARHRDLAKADVLAIEVGGGSTELLLIQEGLVTGAYSYRLGAFRLRETLEAFRAPRSQIRSIIQNQIQQTVEEIVANVPRRDRLQLVALGGDIRFAAHQLRPGWSSEGIARISVDELERLTNAILPLTEEQIARRYNLQFPQAETLGPALLTYLLLARQLGLSQIVVTNVNLRDGLLQELGTRGRDSEHFHRQVLRSVIDLGRKYRFDEPHARHVAALAEQLFDQLADEHHLGDRERRLLRYAALLHEIGQFIAQAGFHKHTQYLIENSDVFGLTQEAQRLVAIIARYHRRASPKPTHSAYIGLPREQRIVVSKLAALLRLADALDRSHAQRIRAIRCERDQRRLVVHAAGVDDVALEQLALREKGSLFEDVYGYKPVLYAAPNEPDAEGVG
ncbi:MAG: HD domain-containing protein, partial [Planctomycetota bacterium]